MKYQIVKQHSEEDCGAACLATIAKHHGRTFTISHVREAVGTGQLGTTLLGIRRGAEGLGFNARSVKASPEVLDRLDEAPLPAIFHWQGKHWVVLYGKRGKKYVVADPAVGIRYLTRKELKEGWKNWVMLLLEPDEVRFYAQPDDEIEGFGRFLRRILPYRVVIAEALVCATVVGLLSLTYPFLIQILTDQVLVRGDTQLLNGVAIAAMATIAISSSLKFVANNLVAHFSQRLQLGFILEFGRQILRLPLTYYENRRSGEIISRLDDIQQVNQLVSQVVVRLPSQFFTALISLGLMLYYSWRLTMVAVLIAILMSISTVIFLPTLRQKVRSVLVLDAENQGVLVESFKGALTLKTTAAAPQFWEELQIRFGRLANQTYRTVQIGILNNSFSELVSGIGGVALLWYGSSLVIGDRLSIGQLLAFNSMNGNFLALITMTIGLVDEYNRVQTATQRLSEVIDATPEAPQEHKKPYSEIEADSDIICSNLTFHYPGRVNLIEDFSLTIPGGKVIAIIGTSGCGKSTLAKIIAQLYQPDSGNIRLGSYNLQDLALDCLRQQVVLVPQDAHFWSRSILENFRLGHPQITFEQIVKACKIAKADEFIQEIPDNYQTILGEFGSNISGGQRQRLAIARGIVTDPPVLILDEATAGLDPVSEMEVLQNIIAHRQGKTTILISHRPTVIQKANWIVLLDQGELKLEGTASQLRSHPGSHLTFLGSNVENGMNTKCFNHSN